MEETTNIDEKQAGAESGSNELLDARTLNEREACKSIALSQAKTRITLDSYDRGYADACNIIASEIQSRTEKGVYRWNSPAQAWSIQHERSKGR